MDDVTKQALLSALRSILAVVGGSLVAHGVINEGAFNEILGAVMVIIPIAWGIVDKYLSEKKTKAREVVAVNAGIAVVATGEVGATVRPADAPEIIKTFAPAVVSPTKEITL
jgi:hypothetical protein